MTVAAGVTAAGWREYRRVGAFLRPYAPRLLVVVAVSLLATLLGLVQPLLSKFLIDSALLQRNWNRLLEVAALMFGGTILGFALNILSSYQYVRISAAMLFDMRLTLYRHLQTLSPRFYAKWRLGDLVSRLNNDIGEVQRVSADSLLSILSNVIFLAGSVVTMCWLNARLFLLSVALVPLCLYVFHHYQRRLTGLTRELRERSADVGSLFVEALLGVRVVVCANAGNYEAERFRERNGVFVETMLRLQVVSFLTGALPGSILTASTAVVFLYGGWMILHGQMTIGSLVAFMAYHTRVLAPVQNMMSLSASLAAARVSLLRIFELLDTRAEVVEADAPVLLDGVRHGIEFKRVSLRHDRDNVLEEVSFYIPAGTSCAILGPSGAGKSTIADLMVRLLDPDAGRVLVDGVDVKTVSLETLRREILLIDQAPYLFHATIAENIGYAWPGATRADIERAGSMAGLDELMRRLPDGYDTKTGERGLALSAGERQRIALARGLLRRPSVLVLDEPTSALDPETEQLIARMLRQELRGSTLIFITHRPALAAIADQVITIRDKKAWTAVAS